MTHLIPLERNASIRSAVAGVLCLALIGIAIPNPSSASVAAFASLDIPTRQYVEIGHELFYVYSGVAQAAGSFTTVIKKAVLPDSSREPAFVLGQSPSADDVTLLGSDLYQAAIVTGTDLQRVQAWREVVAWTTIRTPGFTTASVRVGPDRFSVRIPQSVLDGKPVTGDTIDLEVNGFVVPLETDRYAGLLPGFRRKPGDLDRLLSPLVQQFVDSGLFVNSYIGSALIAQKFFSTHANADNCLSSCIGCSANMAFSVATFLFVVSACVAAVGTGGAMTPACAGALIGHSATNLVMLSTCASCIDCLGSDPPGGGGGGNDPSGECPPGYHECCNNSCCSDENPPQSCDEGS